MKIFALVLVALVAQIVLLTIVRLSDTPATPRRRRPR